MLDLTLPYLKVSSQALLIISTVNERVYWAARTMLLYRLNLVMYCRRKTLTVMHNMAANFHSAIMVKLAANCFLMYPAMSASRNPNHCPHIIPFSLIQLTNILVLMRTGLIIKAGDILLLANLLQWRRSIITRLI